MSHLVNLTSLQQWQDLCTFHVEANSLFHRNITEDNTDMMKNTGNISINILVLMQPTLMQYELHFLHMAHACPYDRHSSHTTFTVTATSYIQVSEKSDLCMETTSPYKGHSSCPSFSQLLHHTSRFLHDTSWLPKILLWLCLSLLMMLALWGAPYE